MDRKHIPDAWIIDELRRRRDEREERAWIPAELPAPPPAPERMRDSERQRSPGCIVIDLWS